MTRRAISTSMPTSWRCCASCSAPRRTTRSRSVTSRVLASGSARPSAEALTEMMRVTHTLKGAAGTVGLGAMVDLAHRLESAFAAIGRDPLAVDRRRPRTCSSRSPTGCAATSTSSIAEPAGAEHSAAQLRDADRATSTNTEPPARARRRSRGFDPSESMAIPTIVDGRRARAAHRHGVGAASIAEPRTPTPPPGTPTAPSAEARQLRVEPERIDDADVARRRAAVRSHAHRAPRPAAAHARARPRAHAPEPARRDRPERLREPRALVEAESELAGQAALLSQTTAALLDEIEALRRTIGELQRGLTRIRMETARNLMLHAARTLRALRRATGVRVELRTLGEDTEFDKAVAEQLVDPITQLLRNAVAHGIEPPEERAARGKPPIATITIRARQDGNLLVLELSDDGRGVDTAALRDRLVATSRWSRRARAARDRRRRPRRARHRRLGARRRRRARRPRHRPRRRAPDRRAARRRGQGQRRCRAAARRSACGCRCRPRSRRRCCSRSAARSTRFPRSTSSTPRSSSPARRPTTVRHEQLPVLRLEALLGHGVDDRAPARRRRVVRRQELRLHRRQDRRAARDHHQAARPAARAAHAVRRRDDQRLGQGPADPRSRAARAPRASRRARGARRRRRRRRWCSPAARSSSTIRARSARR